MNNGTLDRLAAGKTRQWSPRPIILNDVEYESITEAINSTGICKSRIYREIRETNQTTTQCPNIRLKVFNSYPNSKIPVNIDKVNYESLSEAAETIGTSLSNIRKRRKRGTLDRLDRRFAPIRVTLNGETFESLAALARAYGYRRDAVAKRYRRGTLHKLKKRTPPKCLN